MSRDRRRKAERSGRRGEGLAALWLRAKGYKVLAKRMKTPFGEVDLIARRGRLVAFIEVKARPCLESAQNSVGHHARRRIAMAAQHWLDRNPSFGEMETRFDLVAILPRRLPVHMRDAWCPDFAAGGH